LAGAAKGSGGMPRLLRGVQWLVRNAQDTRRALEVNERHYDLGNDLYEAMLGPSMTYTCGYRGRGATTLEAMQEDKFRLICEKLRLAPGQRVLDIGCGFGSFAKFAATTCGVEVTGITLSKEQLAYGTRACAGLPVTLHYLDYRDATDRFGPGSFDHVVSIGMFEAVGPKNYRAYMKQAHAVLREGGIFLLHTIG